MPDPRFSEDDYFAAARALMPRGRLWSPDPTTVQSRVLAALVQPLVRVDMAGTGLLAASRPGTADQLLPEWETTLGLPDPCVPTSSVFGDRQAAAANKFAATGGQSRAYLIWLAASIGVAVAIDEFTPMRAGQSRTSSRCYGPGWQYALRIRVLPANASPGSFAFRRFRAGLNRAGDRLRIGGLAGFECILRRAVPAHASVFFAYPASGA